MLRDVSWEVVNLLAIDVEIHLQSGTLCTVLSQMFSILSNNTKSDVLKIYLLKISKLINFPDVLEPQNHLYDTEMYLKHDFGAFKHSESVKINFLALKNNQNPSKKIDFVNVCIYYEVNTTLKCSVWNDYGFFLDFFGHLETI